jgi:DNA-binding PadR family transcriptional regulator
MAALVAAELSSILKIMQKRRNSPAPNPAIRLPLRPTAFAVLAALAQGARAGFEILEAVNVTQPRSGVLGPGTLYRLLRELRHEGLIRRTAAPSVEASADERRTYMELTPLGRATLHAEADRLRRTLSNAGLLGGTAGS